MGLAFSNTHNSRAVWNWTQAVSSLEMRTALFLLHDSRTRWPPSLGDLVWGREGESHRLWDPTEGLEKEEGNMDTGVSESRLREAWVWWKQGCTFLFRQTANALGAPGPGWENALFGLWRFYFLFVCFCFLNIFIDYAITVVPFPPLHSTPSCPPPPSHIPPL